MSGSGSWKLEAGSSSRRVRSEVSGAKEWGVLSWKSEQYPAQSTVKHMAMELASVLGLKSHRELDFLSQQTKSHRSSLMLEVPLLLIFLLLSTYITPLRNLSTSRYFQSSFAISIISKRSLMSNPDSSRKDLSRQMNTRPNSCPHCRSPYTLA